MDKKVGLPAAVHLVGLKSGLELVEKEIESQNCFALEVVIAGTA